MGWRWGGPKSGAPVWRSDGLLQALELRAADVGQDHAIRSLGRARVQVHGQIEALRDPLSKVSGERDALVHGRLAERDEGNHVNRADAWVLALVRVHVDARDRFLDRGFHRLGHRRRSIRRT